MAGAPRDADGLLSGPRGRRLCHELRPGSRRVDGTTRPFEPRELFDALHWTVASARYFQEPDDEDVELAEPGAAEALRPIAERVCASPAAWWWWDPIDLSDQYEVAFLDSSSGRELRGSAEGRAALDAWRADAVAREAEHDDTPIDPAILITGIWWSTPAFARLPTTTRRFQGHGPVGLYLVEDSPSWMKWARCWPVESDSPPRVFEIGGPGDLSDLAGRYPLSVYEGRRHDWRRTTGQDLPWVVPDYRAVAEDYDVIHLTVAGYLATAGRALSAGDGFTVLAGWDPDATWWLTERPKRIGDGVRWGEGLGHPLDAWAPS